MYYTYQSCIYKLAHLFILNAGILTTLVEID